MGLSTSDNQNEITENGFGSFKYSFTKPEALVFLTLGVLIFINIVGFILALNLVEPITAAIYQPLIPVWTAFWAVLFRVEPANPYMLTGIAISVSGAVVAAMSESHGSHDEGMPPDMPKDTWPTNPST